MLYPLSYEGSCSFVQVRGYFRRRVRRVLGLRALGVPDLRVSNGFLNRVSPARDASVLVSASRG